MWILISWSIIKLTVAIKKNLFLTLILATACVVPESCLNSEMNDWGDTKCYFYQLRYPV